MRKKVGFSCGLWSDQLEYLRQRSKKTGERDISMFVRNAVDTAIKKEKAKEEILDYT